jgi:hypothetical protein
MGGGLAGGHVRLKPTVIRNCQSVAADEDRHTREGGYPVRRGLSAQSLLPLEYWIVRLRGR